MAIYQVPCNGCTRCCFGDAVRILPHEDPSRWQTVPHPSIRGARMLDHKPNYECLYLGLGGCTIHTDKPQMCREMDCRRMAQDLTWTEMRKMTGPNKRMLEVWKRGKELLKTAGAPADPSERGGKSSSILKLNVTSQATDAALSRQVACTNGLGLGGSERKTR